MTSASELVLGMMIAIMCQPAAVLWKQQGLTESFWMLAFLCLLLWFPGMLYAVYIVGKQPN